MLTKKKISLYSWNVNGIRAVERKGFIDWVKKTQPDVLCLQETKAHEEQLSEDLKNIAGYQSIFESGERRGYSGVAIYTKIKPVRILKNIGVQILDDEGRMLTLEFSNFVLFNVYFPNGKRSKDRLNYKMKFYDKFLEYIKKLQKTHHNIVICGDVNTAHQEIDLARPKDNEKISGFLPIERKWVDKFLEAGFIDSFRKLNPQKIQYSWWSMRTAARKRNVGWRIDYFYISKNLEKNLLAAIIHDEVAGSDHAPISIELKF